MNMRRGRLVPWPMVTYFSAPASTWPLSVLTEQLSFAAACAGVSSPPATGRAHSALAARSKARRKRQQLAGDLAFGIGEEVVAKSTPIFSTAVGPTKLNPSGREGRSRYRVMVGLGSRLRPPMALG